MISLIILYTLTHSLLHTHINLYAYSYTHVHTHPSIHSLIHTFIILYSHIHSFAYLSTLHSSIHIYLFILFIKLVISLFHAQVHLFMYSCIQSFIIKSFFFHLTINYLGCKALKLTFHLSIFSVHPLHLQLLTGGKSPAVNWPVSSQLLGFATDRLAQSTLLVQSSPLCANLIDEAIYIYATIISRVYISATLHQFYFSNIYSRQKLRTSSPSSLFS